LGLHRKFGDYKSEQNKNYVIDYRSNVRLLLVLLTILIETLCCRCCFIGIVFANYDSVFRRHHQLCLSILKRFGFGHRVMETRILVEVQEMIRKLREKQGCAFNMKHLTASCIANVMINMIFGRRFDHSDPSFQQMITDVEFTTSGFSMALEIFPLLRFLPYFKQNHAKVLRAAGNFSRFVNQNIAACVEVCYRFHSYY